MKTVAVLLLSMAAIGFAEDGKPGEKKRLESVTWDLKSHKLIWVVQKGVEQDGDFKATSSEKYEITPDEAMMQVADEKRGFTEEEATSLHKLLDTLSLYCAESVVWWEEGQGTKLTDKPGAAPDNKKKKAEPKPEKVDQKKSPEKPAPLPEGVLIAQAYLP